MTTACLPLKSESLYVLPSVAFSVKSGAGSPTFNSAANIGAASSEPTKPSDSASTTAFIAPPRNRNPHILVELRYHTHEGTKLNSDIAHRMAAVGDKSLEVGERER